MRNLKQILLGIGTAGLISCASIVPHASLDIAYVPLRNNEKLYENELRTEIDVSADFLFKNNSLTLGTKEITYMDIVNPSLSGVFNPTFQDYVLYSTLNFPAENPLIQFYLSHNCFHRINEDYILNNYDEKIQVVSQGETKIGVRFELK